jgi:GGDEF domain-containing protein
MLRLRLGLLLVIGWFFVFYNLERINEPIDIATFVYALLPLSLALLILVPSLTRREIFPVFLIGLTATYVILKIQFGRQLFGEALPVTVLEITFLWLSALIFRYFLVHIIEVVDLFEQLMFRQVGMPPHLVASVEGEELYRELKRSRRFQNPVVFSVIDFDPKEVTAQEPRVMKELQDMMRGRFLQARLSQIVADVLRDSDYLVQHGNGFAVLMPETTPDDGEMLLEKLRERVQDELGLTLKVGVATFPENAFTLGGLLDHAQKDAQSHKADRVASQPAPVPSARSNMASPVSGVHGRGTEPGAPANVEG